MTQCVYFKRCGNDAEPGKTRCAPCAETEAERRASGDIIDSCWSAPERDARIDELVELMHAREYGIGRKTTGAAFRARHGISASQLAQDVDAARQIVKRGVPDASALAAFEAGLERVLEDAFEIAASAATFVDVGDDGQELRPDQSTRVQALKLAKDAVMDYAKLRGFLVQKSTVDVRAEMTIKPVEVLEKEALAHLEATPRCWPELGAVWERVQRRMLAGAMEVEGSEVDGKG